MKLNSPELPSMGYQLLDTLHHQELVPFLQTYLKKKTKYSIFYYAINIFIFGFTGYLFMAGYGKPGFSFGDRFMHFSYGLAIAFALVPLHEYIHALAYKAQGAKNTSYDANLKKFYFMALADQFVASKREFVFVALAPFVCISALLIVPICFAHANWPLSFSAALLAHTSMCAGDFGLLSYFAFHKDKELVTYDDVSTKTSYFYGRDISAQRHS